MAALLLAVVAGCSSPAPNHYSYGQYEEGYGPRPSGVQPPVSGYRSTDPFGTPSQAALLRSQYSTAPQPGAYGPGGPAVPTRFEESLDAYYIGPRDLLEVKVFEVEELSAKVRVNRRGSITLPLIGPVPVAGRTITQVEDLIEDYLAKEYLQDPHVAVFIEEFASQKVTVEGYVKKPGVFAMEGQTTLLQAIALAGGVDDIADTDEVFVFRNPYGGNRTVLEFDLDDIEDGKVRDPLLQGTDIVVVDSSSGRRLMRDVAGTLRGFIGFGTLPVF